MGLSDLSTISIAGKSGVITDEFNNNVNFQISKEGGSVNLLSGLTGSTGFYVCIASTGTEGLLRVMLMNGTTYVDLPFFFGWNPYLIKEIPIYPSNTAAGVYWGK